jgi:hypothetical protein
VPAPAPRGDDGRGNRVGRYAHRTRVFVRDAAGRTPLGLAAAAALREFRQRRGGERGEISDKGEQGGRERGLERERERRLRHAAAVVRLLYKMEALEAWAMRGGGDGGGDAARARAASADERDLDEAATMT